MLCSWSRIFIVKLLNEGKYNFFHSLQLVTHQIQQLFNFEGSSYYLKAWFPLTQVVPLSLISKSLSGPLH